MNVSIPVELNLLPSAVCYEDMQINVVYLFGDHILAAVIDNDGGVIAVDLSDNEICAFSCTRELAIWLDGVGVLTCGIPTNICFTLTLEVNN